MVEKLALAFIKATNAPAKREIVKKLGANPVDHGMFIYTICKEYTGNAAFFLLQDYKVIAGSMTLRDSRKSED